MNLRGIVEAEYERQSEGFAQSERFRAMEKGEAVVLDYDRFIARLCRSHLKSPQILAFLFALAPPVEAEKLRHNMLEELGLDEEGVSHPALLMELAESAGFDEQERARLERDAEEELHRIVAQPILFQTLAELGLSVLMETVCFEWMLSRFASRIAQFLGDHRRLSRKSLRWFYHHAEVDKRHADEGIDAVIAYADYYEIDSLDAQTILEVTFRENVFVTRYFDTREAARETPANSSLNQ